MDYPNIDFYTMGQISLVIMALFFVGMFFEDRQAAALRPGDEMK